MALILNIDTATSVCSVALAKDGEVVGCLENNEGLNHSVLLGVYIDRLLQEHHLDAQQLDAVAVSMGPGSYTGLRIGVSTAKGLCFGSGKPLIAVPTLQALANAVARECREDALYCPMLDARRMEVYTAVFDRDNRTVLDTRAEIITPDSFSDLLAMRKVCFFGNGSDKTRDLLNTYFRSYTGPVDQLDIPTLPTAGASSDPNVQYMGQLDTAVDDALATEGAA